MILCYQFFHTQHGKLRQWVAILSCMSIFLYACTPPSTRPSAADIPRVSLYRINADGSGLRLLRDDPTISFWGASLVAR